MLFTIHADEFKEQAVLAARAAAKGAASVEEMKAMLVDATGETVVLRCCDSKKGILVKMPAATIMTNGKAIVEAKRLTEILGAIPPSAELKVAVMQGTFQIAWGSKSKVTLPVYPADSALPELPEINEAVTSFEVDRQTLADMINISGFAVAANGLRPALQGIVLDKKLDALNVVSCDGYRIAKSSIALKDDSGVEVSCIIPGDLMPDIIKMCEAQSLLPVKITVYHRHATIENEDSILTCRRLTDDYINYEKAMNVKTTHGIKLDVACMKAALSRLKLAVKDNAEAAILTFLKDEIKLENSNLTDFVDVDGDGNGLRAGFNALYFIDALKACPQSTVSVNIGDTPTTPIRFKAGKEDGISFDSILLPVRIRET